ncbi:hypothetical protein [Anaeroselena agilis]|uniref:Portal protein n=1 Tax=Anaeroselena agilis TaxID=3063788 RepID=A0ABU3NVU6_9FIRM|nr:hypothetical protein [Selenomonadales bacterium 4137-cl]
MGIEIKLKPKKLQELSDNLDKELKELEDQYETDIEGPLIRRRQLYEADQNYYKQKYPKLSPISDLTASDVQDTIEWALPSLMRIMFQSDDVIALRGTNVENDKNAKVHQDLINFQLQRHANGFLLFYDWFKAALMDNVGILKAWWERDEDIELFEVTADEGQLMQWRADTKYRVVKAEQVAPGIFTVQYQLIKKVNKNQPEFAVISPAEFRYDGKAKNINEAKLVAQRMVVTADWLRRREKEGTIENLAKALKDYGTGETKKRTNLETYLLSATIDNDTPDTEEAKKEYVYYECFWETDVDGDGLLEKVIVGKVGKTIVRLENNTLGRHPFFVISPIREPYRVWAKRGLCDLIGEIQDLKTALFRQAVYNIALANDKQAFINVDVMLDENEFIEGRKAVRVSGNPKDAVYWMPHETIEGIVFQFVELADALKENRTGITRYNQGMQADTLNKTATGISRIMDASQQRLEMILRMFLETGVKDLFRFLISLNQKFIDQATVIRIADQTLTITPDDLRGEIDIVVNAALALGSKEARMEKLQTLLASYQQAIPAGIASVKHAAFVFGKMVEEMGYKNLPDFCFSPDEAQANFEQQQEAAAQGAQQQAEMQMQVEQMKVQMQGQIQLELEKMRLQAQAEIEMAKQKFQLEMEMIKQRGNLEGKIVDAEIAASTAQPTQPKTEERGPSVSISYRDLPASGKVQAASEANITISEEEVKANDQQSRQASTPNGSVSKGTSGGNRPSVP